jgi:hypothetical protein
MEVQERLTDFQNFFLAEFCGIFNERVSLVVDEQLRKLHMVLKSVNVCICALS